MTISNHHQLDCLLNVLFRLTTKKRNIHTTGLYVSVSHKGYCRMMTSSNGIIFYVTGPLCGEFTGPRWIPCTKASDAALTFSLICVWINGWENNREAGGLRCYRAHYDVIVMPRASPCHDISCHGTRTGLIQYKDVLSASEIPSGDKTILRSSSLRHGLSSTDKTSLYWIMAGSWLLLSQVCNVSSNWLGSLIIMTVVYSRLI